jgi:hypothetical protein
MTRFIMIYSTLFTPLKLSSRFTIALVFVVLICRAGEITAGNIEIEVTYIDNPTEKQKQLFDKVVSEFTHRLGDPKEHPVHLKVAVSFKNLGTHKLGETTPNDKTSGFPESASIVINTDDSVSYSDPREKVPSDKYDALTIMRHEMEHALGFSTHYSHFSSLINGHNLFDEFHSKIQLTAGPGGDPHLDPDKYPDDLMDPVLPMGKRRSISRTDIKILRAAYGYTQPLSSMPEPSTLPMMFLGTVCVLIGRAKGFGAVFRNSLM